MIKRLYSDALKKEQSFASLYLLVGADPLLVNEAEDIVVKKALEQGFEEKFRYHIDLQTDWQSIFDEQESLGLFSSRKIFILHAPENLTPNIQQNLEHLVLHSHEEILIIIHFPKLNKTQEKQQWFQSLTQGKALFIHCQTPQPEYFFQYVKNRCQQMNLHLDNDGLNVLCYNYEGNLLALKQALDLLQLLYGSNKISYLSVQEVVEQSSVFTVYQWTDALLNGNFQRAMHILDGLKQEEVASIILLRTLQKELMTVLQLTEISTTLMLDQQLPTYQLHDTFDHYRIWQNRRNFYRNYIQRTTPRQLFEQLQHLANLEREAKQSFNDNLWIGLAQLSMQICQVENRP